MKNCKWCKKQLTNIGLNDYHFCNMCLANLETLDKILQHHCITSPSILEVAEDNL